MKQASIRRAIASGNWMLRREGPGGVGRRGFQWAPVGEWTTAPDWDPEPVCGGGLHGVNHLAAGYMTSGADVVFCETRGPQVVIDREKVKVESARRLAVNDLSACDGMSVAGSLHLSGCSSLTALPEGLSVGWWLNLSGCSISAESLAAFRERNPKCLVYQWEV